MKLHTAHIHVYNSMSNKLSNIFTYLIDADNKIFYYRLHMYMYTCLSTQIYTYTTIIQTYILNYYVRVQKKKEESEQ